MLYSDDGRYYDSSDDEDGDVPAPLPASSLHTADDGQEMLLLVSGVVGFLMCGVVGCVLPFLGVDQSHVMVRAAARWGPSADGR